VKGALSRDPSNTDQQREPSGHESTDNLSHYSYVALRGDGGENDRRPFRHLNLWARFSWSLLFSTLIDRRKRLDDRRAPSRIDTSRSNLGT